MSGEERLYDVVLFGSTGFTGKFVAEELYRIQCEVRRSLRWAAAGRNEDKVSSCLEASGIEGVDVIGADVSDDASLEEMCSKTSVLISCVGPYHLYGEPVIKACISAKCHYVDITGESYFMERMRQQYSEQAREAGVLLVSSCGFDSIPNDLGALYIQRQFHGELAYLDSYVTTSASCFHTGTWESFLHGIKSHRQLQALRRRTAEEALPLPIYKMPRKGMLFYSNLMEKWAMPFPGADKAVMYQSLRHRYDIEGVNPFKVRTFFGLRSLFQAFGMAVFFMMMLVLLALPYGLSLLTTFPWFFSGGMASRKGPSKESLEKATFTVTFEAFGYSPSSADRSKAPDTRMVFKVRGAEPGYVATSAMLVQSALCLVYERDALPEGGYLTPSVAFGDTDIIKNLEDTGKFKIELVESS